jgi:hypothetical protein
MKRAASARILRDHGILNMDFNSIPRHKSTSHESLDESFCSTHTVHSYDKHVDYESETG